MLLNIDIRKVKRINYRYYQPRCEVTVGIIDYIEPLYNQKRRYYKLRYTSPAEYEMKQRKSV